MTRRIAMPLALVVAVLAGCQAKLEAYYNANEKIVARRMFYNNERRIVVDADGPLSRPAVARYNGNTYVAWSHDYRRPSGESVRGIGVGAVPCSFDNATIFDEHDTPSFSTPGLAVYGDELVLAWCADEELILRTSTDGVTWSEPAVKAIGAPAPHVALTKHRGRLLAAVVIPVSEAFGGTVAVVEIGDDLQWGERRDVIAHEALRPDKGVSLTSDGTDVYVSYALGDTEAMVSRTSSLDELWQHEQLTLGDGELPDVPVLVPDLLWDNSMSRLRAAWTDGAQLWLAEQKEPPGWERSVRGDIYTPSLSNPAGAALLLP